MKIIQIMVCVFLHEANFAHMTLQQFMCMYISRSTHFLSPLRVLNFGLVISPTCRKGMETKLIGGFNIVLWLSTINVLLYSM